jgi:hypothetical protein
MVHQPDSCGTAIKACGLAAAHLVGGGRPQGVLQAPGAVVVSAILRLLHEQQAVR